MAAPRTPKRAAPARAIGWVAAACLGAIVIAVGLYGPALHGPFVFDDSHLPFRLTERVESLGIWLAGVRPVLMFTYWVNFIVSGDDPFGYHLVNVVIHAANAGLTFLVLLRLLSMAGWKRTTSLGASAVGALIFLIHPLQTESVSYIAGRSESLESFFLLLAYAVFLYRPTESIRWRESALVMMLFGLGLGAKENAVAFAGVLVLTDLSWPRPFSTGGLRKNWRLYALMGSCLPLAVAAIFRLLSHASSAGFAIRGVTWYQYAFTQARAVARYVQMAIAPFGLSLDHDFPISATVTRHGAIFFILGWIAVLTLAIALRRRFPLACFGLLLFLILLAPTSSVVPIADPLVERRMYLPMLGLLLIGIEVFSRLRLRPPALVSTVVVLTLVYGALCYERNREWGNPEQLFASATTECVRNPRPYIMLAEYLIAQNRCGAAMPYLEEAARKIPDATIYVSWGRALECLGDRPGALQTLQKAAEMAPDSSQVFQLIGLLYGEMKMPEQAGMALRKAVEVAPRSTPAHSALGLWYESMHDLDQAEQQYRIAASLDHNDWESRMGLSRIESAKTAQPAVSPATLLAR
jgi:hypothetical protein